MIELVESLRNKSPILLGLCRFLVLDNFDRSGNNDRHLIILVVLVLTR
jgi:hypothetical protein